MIEEVLTARMIDDTVAYLAATMPKFSILTTVKARQAHRDARDGDVQLETDRVHATTGKSVGSCLDGEAAWRQDCDRDGGTDSDAGASGPFESFTPSLAALALHNTQRKQILGPPRSSGDTGTSSSTMATRTEGVRTLTEFMVRLG